MSVFAKLSTTGLEEAQDRIGGFQPLDTDIYQAKIKAAYAGQSAGGAVSITFILDAGGREYRETMYVTNKKGENFFLNRDDASKKVPLPGFTIVNDICMIASGAPLSEQATEDKVINIYDNEARKEMPKSVPMLVDLIGQTVALGIVRQLENKNEKDGNGTYVPTEETRETNTTEKVFHPEQKLTVAEALKGEEVAKFWDSWLERNKGNTRDKRTIKDGVGGKVGAPRAAAPSAAGAPVRKSLFPAK